ncbi:hypothetical protein E1B28_011078 [Marasmius oreades]|uniref:PX domain-containing protein n=1 Tax=Marasmius oreades TaxID=181124 RepID=A0A9P7URP6_9AGAR|nr:uncharacterized protein E1B28_011078 [Marasmius oreades]KAG7089389.1 hypothetical protein E1B28_011078 [Marasmius oreades]
MDLSLYQVGDASPFSPENYKRSVLRPPPAKFTLDMLSPAKQGGYFVYGMRVNPVNRGDRSSTGSGDSRLMEPYEIWRKWEDCLFFQDGIEEEYGRLARMKRQRLQRGKGVKKNGVYMQDAAASWDSLPPGPDPHSVAQDVHNIIPRLSHKGGSLFGNKHAILNLRVAELSAFMAALFKDDVPTLLQEVRSDRLVTDFFGYWKRDEELSRKNQARSRKHRQSTASTILSFYSGPDDPDARSINTVTTDSPPSPSRQSFSSRLSSSLSPRKRRPRPLSTSSDSSSGSSPSSAGSVGSFFPSIGEEVPVMFDYSPPVQSQSEFQSPPEDIATSLPENLFVRRVKKRSSKETLYRRSARIFSTPPSLFATFEGTGDLTPPETPRNTRRESWQTIDSATTYLEGLDLDLPSSAQIYHKSRLSIGSIATMMTTSSSEAVVPHNPVRTTTPGNRRSRPISIYSVQEGSWSDGDEDMLDPALFDEFPMPAHLFPNRVDISVFPIEEIREEEERPETPSPSRRSESPPESSSSDSEFTIDEPSTPTGTMAPEIHITSVPSSPTYSTYSETPSTIRPSSVLSNVTSDTCISRATATTTLSNTSTLSPTSGETYTIKAAHNKSIILLRIPKTTPFSVLRAKIHEKFAQQEKLSLSDSFTLAFVIPDVVVRKNDVASGSKAKGRARERSSSLSSAGGPVQMALVTTQEQWDKVAESTELNKITLRVLDTIV